jgi:hypothetical protein
VAAAKETPGGMKAAKRKVAAQYVEAFANLARQGNTHIITADLSNVASLVSSAMTVLDRTRLGEASVKS